MPEVELNILAQIYEKRGLTKDTAIQVANSATTGGSRVLKAIVRIVVWGTVSMRLSALVGYVFGISV